MQDILLISEDKLFSHMLTLELSALHANVRVQSDLTPEELAELLGLAPEAPVSDAERLQNPAEAPTAVEKLSRISMLILDLDINYRGLEKMLVLTEETQLPVILFGYPDSEAMTADKMRFYDSDIYRYVFQRPFLMHQFMYCAKELLHYREDEILRKKEEPAMKMKQHSPADDIRFNEEFRQITYKNDIIRLTPTEYETLAYLMRRRGSVVSRAELYDAVRATAAKDGEDKPKKKQNSNVVDVYIRFIRAKIDDPYNVRLIESVRGVGYTIPMQL